MIDKRFFDLSGPFPLSQIAAIAEGVLEGDPGFLIVDIGTLHLEGAADALTFFDPKRLGPVLFADKLFGAVLVNPAHKDELPPHMARILVADPYVAFCRVAQAFYPASKNVLGKTFEGVDPTVQVGKDTTIAETAVIAEEACIGSRVMIGPHVTIGRGVVIGDDCLIHAGATITCATLGAGTVIYPGAQIGQAGFGFAMTESGPIDMPQLGRVIIGSKVSIGANTTIDRGSLTDTTIGDGTRIDNLVQIGHGVQIGKGCIIVAQVGIAGGTKIGDYSALGGQAGLTEHLTIGKGVKIAAQSGVLRNLEDGAVVGGSPAVPIQEWRRQSVVLSKMARPKDKK